VQVSQIRISFLHKREREDNEGRQHRVIVGVYHIEL
jgi:hypothetical protein